MSRIILHITTARFYVSVMYCVSKVLMHKMGHFKCPNVKRFSPSSSSLQLPHRCAHMVFGQSHSRSISSKKYKIHLHHSPAAKDQALNKTLKNPTLKSQRRKIGSRTVIERCIRTSSRKVSHPCRTEKASPSYKVWFLRWWTRQRPWLTVDQPGPNLSDSALEKRLAVFVIHLSAE